MFVTSVFRIYNFLNLSYLNRAVAHSIIKVDHILGVIYFGVSWLRGHSGQFSPDYSVPTFSFLNCFINGKQKIVPLTSVHFRTCTFLILSE